MVENKQILVMGSERDNLVIVTKSGEFIFAGNENFFLEKDRVHSIVPVDSTDFLNYFESNERLKYMNKYLTKKEKAED